MSFNDVQQKPVPKKNCSRVRTRLTCSSPVFGLQAPAGKCRKPLVMTDSVRTGKW